MVTEVEPTTIDDAVRQLREISCEARGGLRRRLSIGIINNMPDSALDATGQQFSNLLRGAADHVDIRIQLFSLPGILRQGAARDRVEADYFEFERLKNMHMDALIVTGSPPGSGALTQEPFWPHFAALVDWARSNTLSTLWSCLSAHAAVLHLDGLSRTRMTRKLSGVYTVDVADHPLMAGLGQRTITPHSRYNALDETALREAGYDILARSHEVGADVFIKATPSLFLFMQGHPEYNADTLAREYRRDVGRFLNGTSDDYPSVPAGYFPASIETKCRAFEFRARDKRDGVTLDLLPDLVSAMATDAPWAASAKQIFRNWVDQILAMKIARSVSLQKAI
jgi:homoserine O-succinyltransferase